MNKARLLKLAEVLESDLAENHFYMNFYMAKFRPEEVESETLPESLPIQSVVSENTAKELTNCGTVACIAGWTLAIFKPNKSVHNFGKEAEEILDIDNSDACKLFTPPYTEALELSNPKLAAKVVRHFVETGKVDWSVAGIDTQAEQEEDEANDY